MAVWPYFLQGLKRGAKFYIFVQNYEKWGSKFNVFAENYENRRSKMAKFSKFLKKGRSTFWKKNRGLNSTAGLKRGGEGLFRGAHLLNSSKRCPPFLSASNFMHHFVAIGEFKLVLQSRNAQSTLFTNPRMHLFHIREWSIQNRNVHIYLLYGAFWDMEQVHFGFCEIGLFGAKSTILF